MKKLASNVTTWLQSLNKHFWAGVSRVSEPLEIQEFLQKESDDILNFIFQLNDVQWYNVYEELGLFGLMIQTSLLDCCSSFVDFLKQAFSVSSVMDNFCWS